MNLKIRTRVAASLDEVKEGFTEELFMALNPPFPPVKLETFDGCKKGDKVALELNFILFKQRWESDIVEDDETAGRWYFVDVGVKLPFFLKTWKHHHEVQSREPFGSTIIDDITFSTGTILTDLIMYPLLFGQFFYRQPIYQRIFK